MYECIKVFFRLNLSLLCYSIRTELRKQNCRLLRDLNPGSIAPWPSKSMCANCKRLIIYNGFIFSARIEPATSAGKMVCVRVEKPFDRCVCDLLGPFPPSPDNKRFVIVLIDSLTKFCETEAIATENAVDTAEFFVKKVLLRHGQIKTLQTDNGTHYV